MRAESTANRTTRLRLALALALLVLALCIGLDRPTLWGDEADTAVIARNVLTTGYPTVWDGANVLAYNNGAELGGDLVSRKLPWIQYYVGAASLAVFGHSTAGARALFALVGVLCLLPLRRLLAQHDVAWPTASAVLLLAAPQTLLFARSARYYSLVMFLFLILTLAATTRWRSERARLGTAGGCLVLIVHTHYLAGLAALAAWVAFTLVFDRARWRVHVGFVLAALGAWALWFYVLVPPITPLDVPGVALLRAQPTAFPGFLLRGVLATVLDLDHVGQLPLLALAALFGLAAAKGQLRPWTREPLTVFVGLNLILIVLAGAAAVGPETQAGYGTIRYLPHVALVLAAPLLVLGQRTARAWGLGPRWCLAGLVLALSLNQLGVSYWLRADAHRPRRVSWWGPVYRDVFVDPQDDMAGVVKALREASTTTGARPLVQLFPGSLNAIAVFYAGERVDVRPEIVDGTPCAELVATRARPEVVARVRRAPDLLILCVPVRQLPGDYVTRQLPLTRAQPDGARPELTRRRFGRPPAAARVWLHTRR